MQLLSLALLLPAAWAATTIRRLEDYNEGAVDGYFKFSQCIRVKVPQDNDDDGNAYFYNGSYRSQSIAYASFLKCEAGCDGTCDPTTAYVAELDAVLQYALTYAGSYCDACTYSCRRRLEEGGDEDGGEDANYNVANVDCDTCVDACARVNGGGSGGSDESDYLDCQYSFTDDNGLDYYSAPTCGSDGSLALGLFYDEDCTIKKSDDDGGFKDQFSYNSFLTMESVCMDCQDGVCDEIADGAMSCVDGADANGQEDDMKVCKTYKRVSKEWEYAKAKKKSPVPVVLFFVVFFSVFVFLSYSYFVRHKNANSASTKTALLETERDAGAPHSSSP